MMHRYLLLLFAEVSDILSRESGPARTRLGIVGRGGDRTPTAVTQGPINCGLAPIRFHMHCRNTLSGLTLLPTTCV